MDNEISDLNEEVEVQEVIVEQLEKDKKELTEENNMLEVDNDALQLDKSSLENELEEVQEKNLELERKLNSKKNETSRSTTNSRSTGNTGSTSNTNSKGRLLGKFESTAYTLYKDSNAKTAYGLKPQVGVIAVDPNVIPLGTKLYVEGYGNAIAGDTGGAIKGRIVDVFFNTRDECMQWGRRQVNVWIVD